MMSMNIEYVGKHFELDDQIKTFTEDKLHKVTKFVEEPVEVRVTLETEKHRHIADIHIAHRFGVLQATEATDNMRDAVNLAVDKVEKQARRSRKKYMDKRRRADRSIQGEHGWGVAVLESSSVGSGQEPKVIESGNMPVKPMTIDEAALALESSGHEFVVFRDAGSDRVNVLYRRRDNNYGLIAPEH